MGETAAEILQRYREVRARLRNPANAVIDTGIDLRRRSYAPPEPIVPVFIVPKERGTPTERMLSLIVKVVADYYRISPAEMQSAVKIARYVMARHVFVYLAATRTKASLSAIGRSIGKHHTSIMSAHKTVLRKLRDPILRQQVAELEERLDAHSHP
jgi:hypothetical protein